MIDTELCKRLLDEVGRLRDERDEARRGGSGWGGGMETLCALALSPTQNHP